MKTILIYHNDSNFDESIILPWLGSFSNLSGVIILKENKKIIKNRIKREFKRSGILKFLDILAFRLYYKLTQQNKDNLWLTELIEKYNLKHDHASVKHIISESVNSGEVLNFIKQINPDFVLARCKQLIKKEIFNLPAKGIFVLHPGITPRYRNAYGLFWAIASGDYDNVGTTLLKIDSGVDTGPVYGYFKHKWDFLKESHFKMQINSVFLNLDKIKEIILDIYNDKAKPLEVTDSQSAVWGQPRLTTYLKILSTQNKRKLNESRNSVVS